MRQFRMLPERLAALHLSFDGFGAAEAASDAFLDNAGSNRVSETRSPHGDPRG